MRFLGTRWADRPRTGRLHPDNGATSEWRFTAHSPTGRVGRGVSRGRTHDSAAPRAFPSWRPGLLAALIARDDRGKPAPRRRTKSAPPPSSSCAAWSTLATQLHRPMRQPRGCASSVNRQVCNSDRAHSSQSPGVQLPPTPPLQLGPLRRTLPIASRRRDASRHAESHIPKRRPAPRTSPPPSARRARGLLFPVQSAGGRQGQSTIEIARW